jgi:hypothetical protein
MSWPSGYLAKKRHVPFEPCKNWSDTTVGQYAQPSEIIGQEKVKSQVGVDYRELLDFLGEKSRKALNYNRFIRQIALNPQDNPGSAVDTSFLVSFLMTFGNGDVSLLR